MISLLRFQDPSVEKGKKKVKMDTLICLCYFTLFFYYTIVESLIKIIYPKDLEISDDIRKQIPKFVWPMRTEK